jgi:sigma-E factor negative regulatory protein RseC
MSERKGIINHEGIVKAITDNSVIVTISAASACSGCHAGGTCNLSGVEEKSIEVNGRYDVKPGDIVTILMKQSTGYAALLLGYVFPLISVITILIVLISLKVPELGAGITSISMLIPYYIVLFFFRKRLTEKFTFTLKV